MPTALYPGSFDPLHLGHLSVIRKASTMFDHVVVAVLGNPDKPSGMFSVADRVDLIRSAARSLSNVTCVNHHGLTVDAVQQTGSDVIIRTGHKDKGDEWSMLAMNELMAGTRTCFVPPDPAVAFLSSSLVRSLTNLGRVADANQVRAAACCPGTRDALVVARDAPDRAGVSCRLRRVRERAFGTARVDDTSYGNGGVAAGQGGRGS